MSSSTVVGSAPGRNRDNSNANLHPDIGSVSATDANAITSSKPYNSSTPVGSAGGSSFPGGIAHDIPPDMSLLLQELEEDFTVNKTIDQWTYINRREEIMQSVNNSKVILSLIPACLKNHYTPVKQRKL